MEEDYIWDLRKQLAKDIGEAAWQVPVRVLLSLAQSSAGGIAALGSLIGGKGSGILGDITQYDLAGKLGIPESEASQRSMEALGKGGEVLDIPAQWIGGKAAETFGPEVGTAVYTGAQLVGPGFVKGAINVFTGFGKTVGKHVPIDLRPQGDLISGAFDKALKGRFRGGFYGKNKGDREVSVIEGGVRALASATEAAFNPKAAAILRKHGLTPTAVRRIQESRKILDDPNVKFRVREHAEKVMIAELRKIYGMKLKAGESISPELMNVVREYHPRLVESKGVPSVGEMKSVLDSDIPNSEMKALVSDMADHVDKGGNNIFTLGGNPQRSSMAGPDKRRILSENPAELFTVGRTTYNSVGEIWAKLAEGQRFDYKHGRWIPKSQARAYNNMGDNLEAILKAEGKKPVRDLPFDADTVARIMKTKARIARKHAETQGTANPNIQSEGVRPRDVTIGAGRGKKDYLLYHTATRSDDPLLAGVPAAILFNPKTGVSRILSYDELDIFSKMARGVGETGYKKQFFTVNSGTFAYPDKILKRAGVKPKAPEDIRYTERSPDMYKNIDKMLATRPTWEYARKGIYPSAVSLREQRDENRKARNVY